MRSYPHHSHRSLVREPWQLITVFVLFDRNAPLRRLERLRVHARQLARVRGRLRRGRRLRGLGGRRGSRGREQATERLQCHVGSRKAKKKRVHAIMFFEVLFLVGELRCNPQQSETLRVFFKVYLVVRTQGYTGIARTPCFPSQP